MVAMGSYCASGPRRGVFARGAPAIWALLALHLHLWPFLAEAQSSGKTGFQQGDEVSSASRPVHGALEANSRERLNGRRLSEKRTWKLTEGVGPGRGLMRVVDLTVSGSAAGKFQDSLEPAPMSCGGVSQCPDFSLCSSGGQGASDTSATGRASLCSNAWLTEGGSSAEESEGLWCPLLMMDNTVIDKPGKCRATTDVFGKAPAEPPEKSWKGGMALLENVYVNQYGDVFNDTHHFYFGACSATEERWPRALFSQVRHF